MRECGSVFRCFVSNKFRIILTKAVAATDLLLPRCLDAVKSNPRFLVHHRLVLSHNVVSFKDLMIRSSLC